MEFGKIKKGEIYCGQHPEKTLCIICSDCLKTICIDCKPDHVNHHLASSNFDLNMLHKMRSSKIPGLSEILRDLDRMKDGSQAKIDLYKKAQELVKHWRDEIIDTANKDADTLIDVLQREIDETQDMLNEMSSELEQHKLNTNSNLVRMTEIRHCKNTELLMSFLAKCDVNIEETKSFIENFKVDSATYSIDDLLPYRHELGAIEGMMHTFFTANKLAFAEEREMDNDNRVLSEEFSSGHDRTLTNSVQDLANFSKFNKLKHKICHELFKGGLYCISGTVANNANKIVTIYDYGQRNVIEFDIESDTYEHFKCDKQLIGMISLNKCHVTLGNWTSDSGYELFVLDKIYQFKCIVPPAGDRYAMQGIGVKHNDVFVTAETNGQLEKTRFTEVTVNGTQLTKKMICTINGFTVDKSLSTNIAIDRKGSHIIIGSCLCLAVINIENTGRRDIDLRSHVGYDDKISSICIDGSDWLVCVESGKIVLLKNGKYAKTYNMYNFWEVPASVNGMAVRKRHVLAVDRNKLKIFYMI